MIKIDKVWIGTLIIPPSFTMIGMAIQKVIAKYSENDSLGIYIIIFLGAIILIFLGITGHEDS